MQAGFTRERGQLLSTITSQSAQALLLCLYITVSNQVESHEAFRAAVARQRSGKPRLPFEQEYDALVKSKLEQSRVALGRPLLL